MEKLNNTLNEWFGIAERNGTSGDMVYDILYDWKKDKENIIEKLESYKGDAECLTDEKDRQSVRYGNGILDAIIKEIKGEE